MVVVAENTKALPIKCQERVCGTRDRQTFATKFVRVQFIGLHTSVYSIGTSPLLSPSILAE